MLIPLDDIDRKIIAALQSDAKLTVNALADRVGLSASPCARRVRQLEKSGSILHGAYLFVPLGFVLIGSSILWPDRVPPSTVLHAWTAGAIVLMTLAVMTRAGLGHSGMPLTGDRRISAIYILAITAALNRIGAGFFPEAPWLTHVAALSWILAFLLFAGVYAPLFVRPRNAS